MSEPKDEGPSMDAVTRALADADLLLPETMAEVARAEAEIDEAEVELPESLRTFAPRERALRAPQAPPATAKVVSLAEVQRAKKARTTAFLSGAASGLLVAAAALLLFLHWETPISPQIGGATGEVVTEPGPAKPVPFDLSTDCAACCAGSACTSASAELRACPSGRSCIACTEDNQRTAYRIRLSALSVSPEGTAWLEKEGHSLVGAKLCASSSSRELGCRAALEVPSDLLEWSSLPTATTSSQLVGGVSVSLVSAQGTTLGSWANSVHASPDTLCRGAALRLTGAGTDVVLGKVSAFFDDSYFVELGRRGTVAELAELSAHFAWQGGAPSIFETSQANAGHFALTLGPYSLTRAEKLRWAVLDAKRPATITNGTDHLGAARPAK